MKNYIQPGKAITCIAPSGGVTAGLVYLAVANIFGVAATTALQGEEYELQTGDVYELPKVSAQAWTFGQVIYWDPVAKLATTVTTDNFKIGVAMLAAANPSGLGRVRLNDNFG